jgi:hypothetical protein
MSLATSSFKCLLDEGWLSALCDNQMICNELMQLKFRNVPSRVVTRVTPRSIEHCTRLMKFIELRHIEDVIGYLGIIGSNYKQQFVYIPTLLDGPGQKGVTLNRTDLIVSSNQSFVRMQSHLFDRIWDLAVPAIQPIAEIQRKEFPEGVVNKPIKVPEEICSLVSSIIESARTEILIVFPYDSVYWSANNISLIRSIGDKIKQNVTVRAVVLLDKSDQGARFKRENSRFFEAA